MEGRENIMKKKYLFSHFFWLAASICISSTIIPTSVSSATFSYSYLWSTGDKAGNNAGICSFFIPDNRPFQTSRTLIVDNSLPNGSIIHSWGYSEFLPNLGTSCIGSGIDNNTNYVKYNGNQAGVPIVLDLNLPHQGGDISNGVRKTSIEGIGIKFYVKADTDSIGGDMNNGSERQIVSIYYTLSGTMYQPPKDVEYTVIYPKAYMRGGYVKTSSNRFSLNSESKISIRAELIKTGDVSSYGRLSLISPTETYSTTAVLSPNLPSGLLAGDAITVLPPACQLRGATDYQVSMGRWVNMASSSVQPNVSLPFSGNIKPVELNLECTGRLNNIEFSFQDAGASPLTNRNISVYDSIGGQLIEGLEIEMSYSGARLNVHKMGEAVTTYKTNTGAHGSTKTNPSDLTYNSQSQAQFGARFIQRSAIKRNGVAYTGPVTGKVNMFVTYH
ncbi:Uncharacterised protein [Leminorella richardii]|uniref:Uncharacterized protein n=2 Tax=Leminorella richardii TaxID=158841 RepID=A0A2X4VFG0_9GAMM|nr:Uncharacterised protein [Leminorella richardii]